MGGIAPCGSGRRAATYPRRMQIRPYIGADKPAVILYPSGTVISFDELEARANRLRIGSARLVCARTTSWPS